MAWGWGLPWPGSRSGTERRGVTPAPSLMHLQEKVILGLGKGTWVVQILDGQNWKTTEE